MKLRENYEAEANGVNKDKYSKHNLALEVSNVLNPS